MLSIAAPSYTDNLPGVMPIKALERHGFAADRECSIALEGTHSALELGWSHSKSLISEIIQLLGPGVREAGILSDIHSIAVAGSVGRMESGPQSDLDLVVIARDAVITEGRDRQLVKDVWKTLRTLEVHPPDENGIFSTAVCPSQLCDRKALGNLDYPRHVFGLRMQVLMDAQPVFNARGFAELQQQILQWYALPSASPFIAHRFQYLMSDLQRYYHSYAVWHQFRFDKSFNDSWSMRQVKIAHSRLVSCVALLLCLLGLDNSASETSESSDASILPILAYTPLERLSLHWPPELAEEGLRVVELYDEILGLISNPSTRHSLLEQAPDCFSALENVDLSTECSVRQGEGAIQEGHYRELLDLSKKLRELKHLLALGLEKRFQLSDRSNSLERIL